VINNAPDSQATVTVWDLPLRLFHWLLVATLVGSWVTHELGTAAIQWHMRLGYTALGLVTFRLIWGFVGSRHARFSSFLTGAHQVRSYARSWLSGRPPPVAGHSPMGGWAVVAMLVAVGLQGISGLFQSDDFLVEGPWHHAAPEWLRDLMHEIHEFNFNVLLFLVVLHLSVIALYRWRLKSDLVRAMITGRRRVDAGAGISGERHWRALLAAGVAAAIVWAIVAMAPSPDPAALFF
jgi:cytochrome b